jgi:hypothetical protein
VKDRREHADAERQEEEQHFKGESGVGKTVGTLK